MAESRRSITDQFVRHSNLDISPDCPGGPAAGHRAYPLPVECDARDEKGLALAAIGINFPTLHVRGQHRLTLPSSTAREAAAAAIGWWKGSPRL